MNDFVKQLLPWAIRKRMIAKASQKTLIDSEFPAAIFIENTNRCNSRCVMCPRDKLTRKQGFMDLKLYEKLILEIASYTNVKVHLHNFGEPLLDKHLCHRVKFAKDNGIAYTYFVTNASLLTPELSRGLIEAGIDQFKISFYGTDHDTYNATMQGLDFDKTLHAIVDFFKIRDSMQSRTPKVILQFVPQEHNQYKSDDFAAIFNPLVKPDIGDCLIIGALHNFGGGRDYRPLQKHPHSVCNFPWQTMVILWDGRVVPCCYDFDGTVFLGDANQNTIREIWNGAEYATIRSKFKKFDLKKYPVCTNCQIIR